MSDWFECYGGPLDGQTIRNRGLLFTTLAEIAVVLDGVVVSPGWTSGVYERRDGAYYWRATP